MTERKFTPPKDGEFPKEYEGSDGVTIVLYGRGNGDFPLIGQHAAHRVLQFDESGCCFQALEYNLHDTPKRITTWHNVYYDCVGQQCSTGIEADELAHQFAYADRQCVYRIERDENGSNPKIFVEKLWSS